MKYFALVTVLLIVNACNGQIFSPGKRLGRRSGRAVKTVEEICVAGSEKKSSCNGKPDEGTETACDATGFVQCIGVGEGIEYPCPGNIPYCNVDDKGEAMCSKEPKTGCTPAKSDFVCLAEGFFPDPLDCKKFFQCTKEGDKFEIDNFQCEDSEVFDPSAPRGFYCRSTGGRFCTEANCNGETGKTIVLAYQFFPKTKGQIVVTCRGTQKPLVFRCGEGYVADLDTMPIQCKFNCRAAGQHPHPDSETKYFDCVRGGGGWVSKVKECYRNYYFNSKKKLCELKSMTPAPPTTTANPYVKMEAMCVAKCGTDCGTLNEACNDVCKSKCACLNKECPSDCGGLDDCLTPCKKDCRDTCTTGCTPACTAAEPDLPNPCTAECSVTCE